MKITPEILTALERAISESGSIYKLARELGISHSTIFFWRTGRTTNINRKTWNSCLRKKLRPYLSAPVFPDEQDENAPLTYMVKEERASYGERPNAYPLVTFKKLAYFDPHIKSTPAFVRDHSMGTFHFVSIAGVTAFALRMDETSKNKIFTSGSTLLVESGRPPVSGEVVIAKCKEMTHAQFYTFKQEGSSYQLLPFGTEEDKNVQWEQTAPSSCFLDWIFPVLEANILFSK